MNKGFLMIAAAVAGLLPASAASASDPARGAGLQVQLSGIRSAKGLVHVCLSADPKKFLRCQDDKAAVSRTVPARGAGRIDLGPVRPGTYALLVVHDENANGKFDMMLGVPREGFGFSNNPAIKPRAPKWEEIRFTMPAGAQVQPVRVRYIL